MKRLFLCLLLSAVVWAGPTYSQIVAVSSFSGTAEFWDARDGAYHSVVLKVKETGKEGEVNVVLDANQLGTLGKEIDKLMKDRTALKAGMLHVTGKLTLAQGASIDLATVRPDRDTLRVLVVKDGKQERTFALTSKNLAAFKSGLQKSKKALTTR